MLVALVTWSSSEVILEARHLSATWFGLGCCSIRWRENLLGSSLIKAWKSTAKIIWTRYWNISSLAYWNFWEHLHLRTGRCSSSHSECYSKVVQASFPRLLGQENSATFKSWYQFHGLWYLVHFGEGCFNSFQPYFRLTEGSHSISFDQVWRIYGAVFLRFSENPSQTHDQSRMRPFWN